MKKLLCSVLFAVAMVGGPAVQATPLVVDAGWYGFCFGGSGSPATAGCQNDATAGVAGNTMTFAAATDVWLKITDAFQYGDTFSIVVDGAAAVLTSVPGSGTEFTDPDAAFGADYSKIAILLAAGAHTVDIFADASPFGGGGGYVQVRAVPLPATLALLGLGLVALGWSRRKRS